MSSLHMLKLKESSNLSFHLHVRPWIIVTVTELLLPLAFPIQSFSNSVTAVLLEWLSQSGIPARLLLGQSSTSLSAQGLASPSLLHSLVPYGTYLAKLPSQSAGVKLNIKHTAWYRCIFTFTLYRYKGPGQE